MADYRLSVQTIGRGSGRSIVAAAAYRAGEDLTCERTGERWEFSRRGGVIETEILVPDGAPDWMKDRDGLWNGVEAAEKRRDAQTAREIQLSLPHELTHVQRRELVRAFVSEQITGRGMVADVAYHTPGKEGDDRNFHAHILVTTRGIDGPSFGKKDRSWNSRDLLNEWREQWAIKQNAALKAALGKDAPLVSHRSLFERGLDREPTIHLGPERSAMERRGIKTIVGDHNRQAAQAWENTQARRRRMAEAQLVLSPARARSLAEIRSEITQRVGVLAQKLEDSQAHLFSVLERQRTEQTAQREAARARDRADERRRLGDLPKALRDARRAANNAEARATGGSFMGQMISSYHHPILTALRRMERITAAIVARQHEQTVLARLKARQEEIASERRSARVKDADRNAANRTEERKVRRHFAQQRREAAVLSRAAASISALTQAGVTEVRATRTAMDERAYLAEVEAVLRRTVATTEQAKAAAQAQDGSKNPAGKVRSRDRDAELGY